MTTPLYECPKCGMKFYTDMLISCPKCFVRLRKPIKESKKKIPLKL